MIPKKILISVLSLWLFLVPSLSFGKLVLYITMVHKKGNNKGLTLTSELHSIEDVNQSSPIRLAMNDGVSLLVEADFSGEIEDYGPSSKIEITGKLLSEKGKHLMSFAKDQKLLVAIGKNKLVTYKDERGQLIEIQFRPQIE